MEVCGEGKVLSTRRGTVWWDDEVKRVVVMLWAIVRNSLVKKCVESNR